MLEPSRNLLWRPLQPQLVGHEARQLSVLGQLAGLGALGTIPRSLVSLSCSIARATTVSVDLAANGGRRSLESVGDGADRVTRHHGP
jgi:hypothetical protein